MFLLLMGDQVLDEAALRALLAGAVRRRWSTPARTPQSLAKVPGLSSRSAGSSPSARVGSRAQGAGAGSAGGLVFFPVGPRRRWGATRGGRGRCPAPPLWFSAGGTMPEGSYWQDVDTPADVAHVQAMLRGSLAKPAAVRS